MNSRVRAIVSTEVCLPGPISTRGTMCGGLKGWATRQRSGCRTAVWISVISSPDELEAIMTPGGAKASISANSFFLMR